MEFARSRCHHVSLRARDRPDIAGGREASERSLRSGPRPFGIAELFARGLEAYPNLAFELLDVMWGLSSIILYYKNQNGTKTGEFMELDADLKVIRVVANYSA